MGINIRTLGCALPALLLAQVSGADTTVIERVTLTQEESVAISRTGLEIVQNIDEARAALARHDDVAARRRAGTARALLYEARGQSPTLRLKDRIAAGYHSLRHKGKLDEKQDLLPLFRELDETDITGEEVVRERLQAASTAARAGRSEDVAAALLDASAAIQYTEIDLPLNEVDQRLSRAISRLDDKQFAQADAELQSAQEQTRIFIGYASTSALAEEEAVGAGPGN